MTRHTPFGQRMLRLLALALIRESGLYRMAARYELVLPWELYWSDLKTELISLKIFSK